MARTIVGLFDDLGTARRAEQTLHTAGLLPAHAVLASSPLRSALAGEGVPVPDPGPGTHLQEADVIRILEDHGVPRERAEHYAAAVRRGGAAVVLVNVDDERAEEAAQLLLQHRPLDPSRRLSALHELGHPGYTPTASPFAEDEPALERNRFADEHHPGVDVVYVM